MMELFDYQKEMVERIGRAFGKHQSVMVQMPTGTGKTIVLSNVVFSFLEKDKREVWVVAHRRELVSQIRETLKRGFSNLNKNLGKGSFPTTPSLLHKDFSNHPVPLSKEGSTAFPKPLSPQGTGDVAGDAIALPEFWSASGACALKCWLECLRNRIAIF